MTFRQQEFARHYAQGKPAIKAALAAGYTQSTAETNAARLLRFPDVINEIRRQRNGLRIVTIDDINRTMTRLMHIIDNAENPAHVLQATAQLLRYLRFQPDVWPEYPDKTDKKIDIAHNADESPSPQKGERGWGEGAPYTTIVPPTTLNQALPDNPDKNPDHRSINYPLSTINSPLTAEFLESVEDYALADLVRQNPIMGKILAHKYANRPEEPEPAYA